MGSPFDAAAASADAVVVGTFAWPMRITPRVKATGKAHQPDPGRTPKDARGVFSRVSALTRLQGERTGTQFSGMTRTSGAETTVWLSAREVAQLGYEPAAPDLVAFPTRPELTAFAVARVGPDERGGLTLTLTIEAGA